MYDGMRVKTKVYCEIRARSLRHLYLESSSRCVLEREGTREDIRMITCGKIVKRENIMRSTVYTSAGHEHKGPRETGGLASYVYYVCVIFTTRIQLVASTKICIDQLND